MTEAAPAYGLWLLVIVNSAVFILFAFSFFKPHTARDWRSFGASIELLPGPRSAASAQAASRMRSRASNRAAAAPTSPPQR